MVKDGCGMEGLETLTDVKEAVEISLDILNDLLSYEKLEAGIMVIEPIKFRASLLISDFMRPFAMQVSLIILSACSSTRGGSTAASGGLRDILPPQRHGVSLGAAGGNTYDHQLTDKEGIIGTHSSRSKAASEEEGFDTTRGMGPLNGNILDNKMKHLYMEEGQND
eukprot:gene3769-7480_t